MMTLGHQGGAPNVSHMKEDCLGLVWMHLAAKRLKNVEDVYVGRLYHQEHQIGLAKSALHH